MKHYYAIYNPYGLSVLNIDGVQANRLYRYRSIKARDNLITDYPEKACRALRCKVEHILRGVQFWHYEGPQAEFATFMGA